MAWLSYLVDPKWNGRRTIRHPVNWARVPEGEVAVGLIQYKTKKGHSNRWYLLFRRWNEADIIAFPVFSQDILTTGAGSNQTVAKPASWNNIANFVEIIAGGGGGAGGQLSNLSHTGGGGGEYGRVNNFTWPAGTVTYRIGLGAASQTSTAGASNVQLAGNAGGDSWWNGTTQAGSTLGAIHGGGGLVNTGTGGTGGTGGVGSGAGFSHNAGGRGGQVSSGVPECACGGGGAGGPNGAGEQGVDTSTSVHTNGGRGDAGSGGSAGIAASPTGGAGGNGTEWTTAGSGGGGGGTRAGLNGLLTSGAGGSYGGGSGAVYNDGQGSNKSTQVTIGAGKQGVVVLNWTPALYRMFLVW